MLHVTCVGHTIAGLISMKLVEVTASYSLSPMSVLWRLWPHISAPKTNLALIFHLGLYNWNIKNLSHQQKQSLFTMAFCGLMRCMTLDVHRRVHVTLWMDAMHDTRCASTCPYDCASVHIQLQFQSISYKTVWPISISVGTCRLDGRQRPTQV